MVLLFALLIIFQLKHFLADYPLQGKYMLRKFLPGWGFFLPLLAHTVVHGAMTAAIVAAFTGNIELAAWLALLDVGIHFTMDRIKAGPKYLGRFKPLTAEQYMTAGTAEKRNNVFFWWSLGFDQMIHHLTHYVIIYIILTQ